MKVLIDYNIYPQVNYHNIVNRQVYTTQLNTLSTRELRDCYILNCKSRILVFSTPCTEVCLPALRTFGENLLFFSGS